MITKRLPRKRAARGGRRDAVHRLDLRHAAAARRPPTQYTTVKAAEIHSPRRLPDARAGPDGLRVNALNPGSILFEGGSSDAAEPPTHDGSSSGSTTSSRRRGSDHPRRSPTPPVSCSRRARAGSAARTSSWTVLRTRRPCPAGSELLAPSADRARLRVSRRRWPSPRACPRCSRAAGGRSRRRTAHLRARARR